MAKDYDALKVELEKPRYDTDLRAGRNARLVELLNEVDPASSDVWMDTPVLDIMEAAGQARLKALTPDQRGRLTVIRESGQVALSRDPIRAELLDVFGISENILATAIPDVRRKATYGEAFGFERVSINDVRQVVRLISKSFIVATGQV